MSTAANLPRADQDFVLALRTAHHTPGVSVVGVGLPMLNIAHMLSIRAGTGAASLRLAASAELERLDAISERLYGQRISRLTKPVADSPRENPGDEALRRCREIGEADARSGWLQVQGAPGRAQDMTRCCYAALEHGDTGALASSALGRLFRSYWSGSLLLLVRTALERVLPGQSDEEEANLKSVIDDLPEVEVSAYLETLRVRARMHASAWIRTGHTAGSSTEADTATAVFQSAISEDAWARRRAQERALLAPLAPKAEGVAEPARAIEQVLAQIEMRRNLRAIPPGGACEGFNPQAKLTRDACPARR